MAIADGLPFVDHAASEGALGCTLVAAISIACEIPTSFSLAALLVEMLYLGSLCWLLREGESLATPSTRGLKSASATRQLSDAVVLRSHDLTSHRHGSTPKTGRHSDAM